MKFTKNGRQTATLVVLLGLSATHMAGVAQTQERQQQRDQTREQSRDQQGPRDEEPIYGGHLLTEQERNQHREKMRNATTEEERERIRAQHHEQMKERARARGVVLPDQPPPKGMGYGRGGPAGQGPGGGR